MTDELTILAEKYGSDKCPSILHTYTPEYNKIFNDIRTTTKSLLEIGIGNFNLMSGIVGETYKPGASLRMWRDYFPNANIYSCDIVEEVVFQDERIHTWVANQRQPASLENLVTKIKEMGTATIDIIIDDGSHLTLDQVVSFITLWKYVSPGGIYIIEDADHRSMDILSKLSEVVPDVVSGLRHTGPVHTDGFVLFKKSPVSTSYNL
jgi:8-demethyl-8-alpha-L-rhamnosyltetracenomycin-C 2'-O-methyltransferase